MKITITIKTVYGKQMAYPACEQSKLFATLLGTKTLTKEHLATIGLMGYAIATTVQGIEVLGLANG